MSNYLDIVVLLICIVATWWSCRNYILNAALLESQNLPRRKLDGNAGIVILAVIMGTWTLFKILPFDPSTNSYISIGFLICVSYFLYKYVTYAVSRQAAKFRSAFKPKR